MRKTRETKPANDCIAEALETLMENPKYRAILPYISQISTVIQKIDSEQNGLTEELIQEILTRVRV